MNKHQHSGEKLKNWLEQNKLQEEHYGQYIAGIDPVERKDEKPAEMYIYKRRNVGPTELYTFYPDDKSDTGKVEKVPWWKALYRKYMKG